MKTLRSLVVRAQRPRFADRFLPLPLRRAAAAMAMAFMWGCTSAAGKVATAQNSYDWRLERYLERCGIQSPPSECVEAFTTLRAAEKHLHEAARALKAGGGLPLQLAAVKADAKKLGKMAVTR